MCNNKSINKSKISKISKIESIQSICVDLKHNNARMQTPITYSFLFRTHKFSPLQEVWIWSASFWARWHTNVPPKVGVDKVAPWQCARTKKFEKSLSLIVIVKVIFSSSSLRLILQKLKLKSQILSSRLHLYHHYFCNWSQCRQKKNYHRQL